MKTPGRGHRGWAFSQTVPVVFISLTLDPSCCHPARVLFRQQRIDDPRNEAPARFAQRLITLGMSRSGGGFGAFDAANVFYNPLDRDDLCLDAACLPPGVRRTALACRGDVRNSRDGFADRCRTVLLAKTTSE